MKAMIQQIINYLNPNSPRNVDKNIAYYLSQLKIYNVDTSHIKTVDFNNLNLQQKIAIKKDLKKLYDNYNYASLEDTIDKTW